MTLRERYRMADEVTRDLDALPTTKPRIPWGALLVVTWVIIAVGHGVGVNHLATWKKAYLVCAVVLLASAFALDALARRRNRR